MKYLCTIYVDEAVLGTLGEDQWRAMVAESRGCLDELRASGQCLAAERLEPVRTAATLRVRDGQVSITDGPFAETKEQLGGFALLEARDLNEAIQIASRLPPARLGCIEVRPVMDLTKIGSA